MCSGMIPFFNIFTSNLTRVGSGLDGFSVNFDDWNTH